MRLSLIFIPARTLIPAAETESVECRESTADQTICHCLQVKESQVVDSVAVFGAETVKDVVRACGAGGGCNSCHAKIRQIIEARIVTVERTETVTVTF